MADRNTTQHPLSRISITEAQETDNIPFPSTPHDETRNVAHAPGTSSSRSTPPQRPSNLPSRGAPLSPMTRMARLTNFANSNVVRGFRRSLDASTSLPSFSTTDFASPHLSSSWGWGSPHNFATHLETSGEHPQEGEELPLQRVAFESDRSSLPSTSGAQAGSRMTTTIDPNVLTPALRSSIYKDLPKSNESPKLPSSSHSRATSPLRIFQQFSAGLHRSARAAVEDPFVPVDPFKPKTRTRRHHFRFSPSHHNAELNNSDSSSDPFDCEDVLPISSIKEFLAHAQLFISDTIPRQIYLHLLLRIPAMYFTRVSKIFEDAEVSRPDIERIINENGGRAGYIVMSPPSEHGRHSYHTTQGSSHGASPPQRQGHLSPGIAAGIGVTTQIGASPSGAMHVPLPCPDEWSPPLVSPALIRFKHSWEAFIDSLMREWKTLNLVSALLASAILTIFQIPAAGDDPVTRTTAFLSLICALMSLSYGCIYIVKFGTMRSMYRASRWAQEARKNNTIIWWNVWVLLSMPATWMSWSMILFCVSILSFVWRTDAENDPKDGRPPMSTKAALGLRILITSVFVLGLVYLALIITTLRRYGTHGGTRGILGPGVERRGNADPVRAREVDAAMERRGRERQRSTSHRVRTREEGVGRAHAREANAEVDQSRETGREKGTPKSALGLTGMSPRPHGSTLDFDLEKGDASSVLEFDR